MPKVQSLRTDTVLCYRDRHLADPFVWSDYYYFSRSNQMLIESDCCCPRNALRFAQNICSTKRNLMRRPSITKYTLLQAYYTGGIHIDGSNAGNKTKSNIDKKIYCYKTIGNKNIYLFAVLLLLLVVRNCCIR